MSTVSGQTDVERVRDATDLVALIAEHVPLKPRGREHVGLCPFHDDHSPSMAVVTHKGQAFYKCHACGAAGDAFRFVMEYHRKDFSEALAHLAQRAGITLTPRRRSDGGPARSETKASLRTANSNALAFFRRTLRDEDRGRIGREAIERRGISDDMVEQFQVGLAPPGYSGFLDTLGRDREAIRIAREAGLLKTRRDSDGCYDAFRNRLIFPIADEMGSPIAFGGRLLDPDDQPKYLNSAESEVFHKSRTLYGLHLARRPIIESGRAVVTEGYTDVIACHQAGFRNVVGTLGTALTAEHARLLSRLCDTVVLVFDGDEAGQRAADRGVEVFFSQPVDVRICVLPDGKDPDDLLRQPDGVEQFTGALEASEDALVYKVTRFARALGGRETMTGREKLLKEFLRELADLGFSAMQGVRKRWTLTRVAELLQVPVGDIEAMLPRRRSTREPDRPIEPRRETEPSVSGPSARLNRARRMAERELLAVLTFDPATGLTPVQLEDREPASLLSMMGPDDFGDPVHHAIGRFVFARLEAGNTFTVAEMLEELEGEETHRVASSLFFDGNHRCEIIGSPELALADAVVALRQCLATEHFQRNVTAARSLGDGDAQQQLAAFNELLEKRRQIDSVTAAITPEARA